MAQGYTEQRKELKKKWRKLHTHGFQICGKGSYPTGSWGDPRYLQNGWDDLFHIWGVFPLEINGHSES